MNGEERIPARIAAEGGGSDVAVVIMGLSMFVTSTPPTATAPGTLIVPQEYDPKWSRTARALVRLLHEKAKYAVVGVIADPAMLCASPAEFHKLHGYPGRSPQEVGQEVL